MLRSIVRRCLKLALVCLMIIAYLPAAAIPVHAADLDVGITGLTVSYDTGTWTASGNSLNGSATGKAKGTCDDATSQTSTLTLKNSRSSAAQLSFNYARPTLASGGSVTIDGTAVTAAGSFVKEIPANGTVTVVILSGTAGAYTSSVSITNISLITAASVTTTFKPAAGNGSYKVDADTITETTQITRNSIESYTLTAAPASGYKLEGWYSETQDAFLSWDSVWTAYFETPQTIYPVYIPSAAPVWEVSDKWFTDLNEAISYANTKNTEKITLIVNGTLSAGTYTIPSGKSVLIPYDSASTLIKQSPVLVTSSTPSTPSAFRTLTLASGANIIVNGNLATAGRQNSHNNGYTGVNTGAFGWISMNSGSSITLNSGSNLYCWGYITGAGTITANSGSKVYEPFQICDIRGGTATSSMNGNSQKVFPVSQYYVQNIESAMTILYGASLNVVGTATVQNVTETPNITFAGSSGALFTLTSGGSLTMRYDPSADRNYYDIYGNAALNSFSMNVGISIDSAKYVLPLMENTTIRFRSGTTTTNQDLCLIPGFEGIIDAGATLKIASGKSVYVYDRDQWIGYKFLYPSVDLRNSYYSPTRANANKFSAARMADAKLDINGMLDAAGGFYTTEGKADIISSQGTGSVVFTNTSPAKTTYQATQANTSISYTSIPVTSAALHNGTQHAGTADEYTDTSSSAKGDTYTYDAELQKWGIYTTYTVTFDDDNGNVSEVPVISGHTVQKPEDPEKEGYYFAGWYNGDNEYDFAEPVTGDLTLKAKWEELTYVLKEWKWSEDYTQASAVFVGKQDETKTQEVEAEITSAVTEATCEEDGRTTYTASVNFDGTTYTDTKEKTMPALGHTYGLPEYTWSEDNRTVTASAVCTRDETHTVTETADTTETVTKEPECETAGEKTYTAVFENELFETQTRTEMIEAPGHDWDEGVITKEPACEEPGIRTYTCKRDPSHTRTEEIPALGHKYGEPTYTWSSDNSTVTAEAVCEHDPKHVITETAAASEKITAEPKCETAGEKTYTAVFANELFKTQTKTAVIEPLGHLWDEGTVTVQPECEKEGMRTYTCQRDDSHTKTVSIPALGHLYGTPVYTWSADNSRVTAKTVCDRDPDHIIQETADTEEEILKAASCTETGERKLTADFVNALFSPQEKTEGIAALGHEWSEWTVVREATEEEGGLEERVCSRCGEKETRETTPLQHTHHMIHTEAKAPTCEADGRSEYWTCEKCGKYYADEDGETEIEEGSWVIPALGHQYGEPTYTWSADNSTVTAEAVCDRDPEHVVTETVSTARKTTGEPSCETEGRIQITAAFENEVFSVQTKSEIAPALGHDWDEGVITKEPSCEEAGIRTYTCKRDASHTRTEEIPATGHKYGTPDYVWSADNRTVTAKAVCENDPKHVLTETVKTTEEVTSEPKCETAGEMTYTAVFENELFETQIKKEVIKALGHDWDDGAITKEPSCEEPGIRTYTCKRDPSHTRTEEIPALGHKYGTPTYTWAADNSTVTAEAVCEHDPKHVITETVSTAKKITAEPKCETAGEKTYTAEFENELFETQTKKEGIEALGHDWDDGTVTKEPSCEEPGIRTYTCKRDPSHTRTEEIPALGHKYGEPTYEWSGDNSTVTAKTVCEHDHSHVVTETVKTTAVTKEEDCETAGSTTYTASFTNTLFSEQTKTVEIPAAGHKYGEPEYVWAEDNSTVTAKAVCEHDQTHVVTETVQTTAVTKDASCTEAGSITYTASFANTLFSEQTKVTEIPAAGHKWGEPVWTWSDDHGSASAKFTCEREASHTAFVEAKVTSEITTEAGCETAGVRTYTAEVTFEGKTYTDKVTETIPAAGHKYGEPTYEWTADNSSVTAKAVCENNPDHVVEETAEVTEAVTTEPGCESEGVKTLTAEFENEVFETQTKTESIEALGHDWGEWEVVKEPTKTETGLKRRTCKRCGEVEEEEIPMLEPVNVTSVELNKDELTLRVGKEETLIAAVLPEDADDKSVTWSSSDTSIATVDSDGIVTAVADLGIAEPSTAVITVTTTDGSYTATCTVTVEDPINAFVRRLYRLCFNRKADEGGFRKWTGELRTKKNTAAETVRFFFTSTEYKNLKLNNEDFVEMCYQVMMDRNSDAGGKKTWLEDLDAGVSEMFVLKGFVGSTEFDNICKDYGIERGSITVTEYRDQNLGVTKFVSRCYSEVLGRKADVGGLNNWCKKILTASNRKQAAIETASAGFFHSTEYQNKKTTNAQYVTTLYRTFLGREPDTGGYNNWMKKLSSGTTRDTVLMGFANSTEFAKIMEEYGIK